MESNLDDATGEWTVVTASSPVSLPLDQQDGEQSNEDKVRPSDIQKSSEPPAVYVVVEAFIPEDRKAAGGMGSRVLEVFSTLEAANDFAKQYAKKLMKYAIKHAVNLDKSTLEEVQSKDHTKVTMKARRDTKRHTEHYQIYWRHWSWVGASKYAVKDAVPAMNGRPKYMEWAGCVIKPEDHHPHPRSFPLYHDDLWSGDEDERKEDKTLDEEKDGETSGEREVKETKEKRDKEGDSYDEDDDYNDFYYDGWLWSRDPWYCEDIEVE